MTAAVEGGDASAHSVDDLIRNLFTDQRQSTTIELQQIVEHVTSASFPPTRKSITQKMQQSAHQHGHSVGIRGDGLTYHWAKHVVLQEQWNPRLSVTQYREYLNDVINHPETQTRISVDPKQRTLLYFIADVADIVSIADQGRNATAEIMVIYDPEIGMIRTGFMLPNTSRTRAQRGIWLRH